MASRSKPAGATGHDFQRGDRVRLRPDHGLPWLADPGRTYAGAVVGEDEGLLVIRLDAPVVLRGASRDRSAVSSWRVEHEGDE